MKNEERRPRLCHTSVVPRLKWSIVIMYDLTSHVPGAPMPASEPAVPILPSADWAATSVTILVEGDNVRPTADA
jgi:hypothetical protein